MEKNNGAAVADYDNDGDLDLFVVAREMDKDGVEESHSRLLSNNANGTFKDVTNESGLYNLLPFNDKIKPHSGFNGSKSGVSWGDYDNDGYPDLFLTYTSSVQLFHNEGDGTFLEKTNQAGIKKVNNCFNTTSTWFDVNNDGFLDLYISEWGECNENYFYLNKGDGTFTDVTEQFGVNSSNNSYMTIPFDFNEDGWMDLYLSNDGQANMLLINQEGKSFVNEADKFGLNSNINDMGMTVGDYNLDGKFDIFITGIYKNILFENKGNSTFKDSALEEKINNTKWAWGTLFADFDLDGDEDLFIVNGYHLDFAPIQNGDVKIQNNVYYKNLYQEGENTFTDFSNASNLGDKTISVSSVGFDYDNDGDLDLYVTNNDRTSFLYENTTTSLNSNNPNNWFKVDLEGTTSNRDAIGTIVKVYTENKELLRYYSGVSFFSQSLQSINFGLGNENKISKVTIKWPSGLEEVYNNFDSNLRIKFIEGNGFEIVEEVKVVKLIGCTDPNSCNYNPEAVIDDGSCEYLSKKEITGPKTSGYFKIEKYSYKGDDNSSYIWELEGGEIISGRGTSQIDVKWEFNDIGKIRVVEKGENCSSEIVELNVTLSSKKMSENNSIARIWNEALLIAIRGDYARPTVHARNLFHTSIAFYDSWAIYNQVAKTYLIGNKLQNYSNDFEGFNSNENIEESRIKTISYAAYRLLNHRFKNSPKYNNSKRFFDLIMNEYGYDRNFISTDYSNGDPAALGNFIAESIINYGFTDNSNEELKYENKFYTPINEPLAPKIPGNKSLTNPNRWQPLSLDEYIDQSGNLIEGTTPEFLSPEWGLVSPFALVEESKETFLRNDNEYIVYHNPKDPPQLNIDSSNDSNDNYKWGFSLVSIWGSHLDTSDGVLWDISPKSIGNLNIKDFPNNFNDFSKFYNETDGGDFGKGRTLNPYTKKPYEEEIVPRGDYTRVLAEFWADGPDSETPPGHWFTLLNYVNDHSLLEKKFNGKGEGLNALEWDVKSYFILGGAMHDAAISAWGIKGWHDYIRPISAIRYMAELGQSSNSNLSNYHVEGIPLKEGFIEVVQENDPLEGNNGEHIGKIKLYSWKGHKSITNPIEDAAGVGWILAEEWWPYQRPSFVTPPFAGYVSGHSTYSRAAAEVLTLITGDEFFPGGMGEFVAIKNEFLVFENGPSVDVKLQWATYRDASDQCSLSRIWGGIHPPADDIPGRIIGENIGKDAFNFGVNYFTGKNSNKSLSTERIAYPNPVFNKEFYVLNTIESDVFRLIDVKGTSIILSNVSFDTSSKITKINCPANLASGVYFLQINNESILLFIK
ncbi:FG-GAP-like repeat-containing protein [Polaribacter sp. SA4-12]|uniref:FG-GAP-like repeat-containing protein n=1 Tax=Polaribacter sp. SA4-12 TaxID=1312072 RepID=UPI001E396EF7|nr:FG-GAP-like repeat-containing protein [Polaribacter sp. SA4-12]